MVGAPRLGARPDHGNRLAARCCPYVRARSPPSLLCAPACPRCCCCAPARAPLFLRVTCAPLLLRAASAAAVVARPLLRRCCCPVACACWCCVSRPFASSVGLRVCCCSFWCRARVCAFLHLFWRVRARRLLRVIYCVRPLRRRVRVRVYSCSFYSYQ